jgi:hypothetical protein
MDSTLFFENEKDQYWFELGCQSCNITKIQRELLVLFSNRFGKTHAVSKTISHNFSKIQSILDDLVCNDYDLHKHSINVIIGEQTVSFPFTRIFYEHIETNLITESVNPIVIMNQPNHLQNTMRQPKYLKKVTTIEKEQIITFYNELLQFIRRLSSDTKLTEHKKYGYKLITQISKLQKYYDNLSLLLDIELM